MTSDQLDAIYKAALPQSHEAGLTAVFNAGAASAPASSVQYTPAYPDRSAELATAQAELAAIHAALTPPAP